MLVGVLAIFLAPFPMYWFVYGRHLGGGGRGIATSAFVCLVCQIIACYVIGAILILLGYGHRNVRRWARTLSLTLLYVWLVLGLPLTLLFFYVLFWFVVAIVGILLGLLVLPCALLVWLVLPRTLIQFYESRDVVLTFETKDPNTYWTEKVPLPILVLTSLLLFYVMVLPLPMMLNGVFAFFGVLLSGYRGILAHNVLILCFIALAWGTFRQRKWAWWGAVICFTGLLLSSVLTFPRLSYAEILNNMAVFPSEAEHLQRIPFHGIHFAVLVGVPFIATLRKIIVSREHFGIGSAAHER